VNRNIAFLGGDSQVGTTMISQSVAEELSRRHLRTLFVQASGKTGDDYFVNKEEKTIDDIRANLINGYLDRYELNQNLTEEGGLFILPAVRSYAGAGSYPENVIMPLVSAAGDFDVLIFDCGDDLRSGLVISALMECPEVFVVLTQQEKTLRRFRNLKEQALDMLKIEGRLLINKYQSDFSLLSEREIERLFAMDCGGRIPYVEYGWQAEIEHKTLMGSGRFRKAVEEIASDITGETAEERSWIKNLISRNT